MSVLKTWMVKTPAWLLLLTSIFIAATCEARPHGKEILYYSHQAPPPQALKQIRTCIITSDLIFRGHAPSYRPSDDESARIEQECKERTRYSEYYYALVLLDLLENGELQSIGNTEMFSFGWNQGRIPGASPPPAHASNDLEGFEAWKGWWEANKDKDVRRFDRQISQNIQLAMRDFLGGTPELKVAAAKDLDFLVAHGYDNPAWFVLCSEWQTSDELLRKNVHAYMKNVSGADIPFETKIDRRKACMLWSKWFKDNKSNWPSYIDSLKTSTEKL